MFKKFRIIAALTVCVMMFSVAQPAFAGEGGSAVGGLLGGIAGFFLGGPAGAWYGFCAGAAVGTGIEDVATGTSSQKTFNDIQDIETMCKNGEILGGMYNDYKNGQFKENWNNGTYDRQIWDANADGTYPGDLFK